MKRGAGYLALFAFLITGLRFASGPATIRESSGVQAQERTAATPKTMLREENTCPAFDYPAAVSADKEGSEANGEIARLIDRFLYGSAQSQRLVPGQLPDGIRLMIATIPDPRHTHLSLQFDRALEAIQQAAQDERYTYDSSWLPWKTERVGYGSLSDRKAEMKEAAGREVCPGLILFRRSMSVGTPADCRDSAGAAPRSGDAPYQCGLFVFVVGEEPTAGLNRIQWDNALHWIDGHANKSRADKALRVLGPNFSGSMPSFVRALEDTGMYAGTFTSTLLYTGRIRGCASWRWLKRQLNPLPTPGAPQPTTVRLPVRVADFEENDAVQTDRLYRYLKDRGHRLSEIAILSEDETAYGGLPDAAPRTTEPESPSSEGLPCSPEYYQNDRPVHLYYPRDISAIQSAYQEQSIFSQGTKTESGSSQPRTVLRQESNQGVHEETDTIAPFSGNNLALTQEAQLYGIVNTLAVHGIRYIVLRSTNSLDYLFLTRFMHRAYPTAYIITMGSDLLFAREVDSTEFRGVAALSSFPLLPRGQDWTRQVNNVPQHAHRVFGAYTMEGAYLAGRFLITDPGTTAEETRSQQPFRHPAKADIPDYALPFWEMTGKEADAQPATWLAVVGRDGYWPLATLKDTLGNSPRFSSAAVVEKSENKVPRNSQDEARPQRLSLSSSWRFCSVLAILLFAMHYFACRYGWDRQDLGMFVQFTRLEGQRGPTLIAAGWTAVCCLLLILFLSAARMFVFLDPTDQGWVVISGVATAGACVLSIFEMRWWSWPTPRGAAPPDEDARKIQDRRLRFCRVVTAWMFLAIVLFGVAGWLTFEFGDNESGITTAYRAVHLTSGVSPLVSLIAMLAGFYWWFWQSLAGLALLGDGRPLLPRGAKEQEKELDNQLGCRIDEAALPFPRFGRATMLMYLLPLFLVLLLAFVLQRAWMQAFDLVLHSMENIAFNRTMHVLTGMGLYLVLLEAMQFYSTWLVLKRLLVTLDRMPLRRTFAALQGLSMRSLWRLSGAGSRARAKVFSRQMESLRHLGNELNGFECRNTGTAELRESVRATWEEGRGFVERRAEGRDFAMLNNAEAKGIRIWFRGCAETVMDDLLTPEWRAEHSSLEVQPPAEEGEAHERIQLSNNLAVRAGEEFVCLIYVGYLQNLLGRMRTMVLSMAGMFAAMALAVGLYPYTPRPTISLSLLLLLLLIGAVVGTVFAGLDRDSTLSHITNTQPGSLGVHFWLRMMSFIGVPALGLIVSQFPEITDFVFSWIAPTMGAVK